MILSRVAVRRRLPDIRGVREGLTTACSLRTAEVENFWTRLVKEIEQRGVSLADSDDRSVRAKLIAAGYTHPQAPALFTLVRIVMRSEEHTSELQSLMSTSYAVFCLKKKIQHK